MQVVEAVAFAAGRAVLQDAHLQLSHGGLFAFLSVLVVYAYLSLAASTPTDHPDRVPSFVLLSGICAVFVIGGLPIIARYLPIGLLGRFEWGRG